LRCFADNEAGAQLTRLNVRRTVRGRSLYFELSVTIDRPPEDVFGFLAYKDRYPQKPGSPVLVLEKLTPGPPSVDTRYREVVRMFPLVSREILSRVTRFEPPRFLEEDFVGPGPMRGHLAYEFSAADGGTRLVQRETLEVVGPWRLFSSVVERMLGRQLRNRLEGLKSVLESGRVVEVDTEL
jgi:hypothetical protein